MTQLTQLIQRLSSFNPKGLCYSSLCEGRTSFCFFHAISSNIEEVLSINPTIAFRPLGNSDHVSVSINFPSNSKRDVPFYRIAYDYYRADWDGVRDHLRDVPWEGIFKLGSSADASEFCEWFQV